MRIIIVLFASLVLCVSSRSIAQLTPDPSPDQFIDVSEEPRETIPLEKLIVYPDSAYRNGIEGNVTLQSLIGKDGSVEKVEVLKSTYGFFKDAAVDAMKREKFTPGNLNGTPLKLWITRTIKFKLSPVGTTPVGSPIDNKQNEDSSSSKYK
jgi:TonB family protein